MVRNPPAMQETRVQSLGQENPLEKGMAHTPVFLPGEFHGQRSLAGYSPWGRRELDTTEQLIMQKHLIVLYPSQSYFLGGSYSLSICMHNFCINVISTHKIS